MALRSSHLQSLSWTWALSTHKYCMLVLGRTQHMCWRTWTCWSKSSQGQRDDQWTGSIFPMRRGWEKWVGLFGREKRRSRGFYQNKEMPEGKWRGRNQAFLSGSQQQEKGKWAQTEIWEALSEDQEILFHCEVDWTLAQVAQGGGRICILGDILKSHQNMVLRQAALGWPCLSKEAGPGATIKWICELSTCSLGGSSIRKGESHLLHTKHMVLLRHGQNF